MRKWQAIPVAGAAALLTAVVLFAVAVTVPALLGAHNAGAAGTTVEMAVDCSPAIGVQNSCTIDSNSVAAIPIDVVLSNFSGAVTTVAAFNYDLYNDQCFSTNPPGGPPGTTGCTTANTANPAGGIGPGVPVQDPANFPVNYGCSSPPPQTNVGNGATGTSTSFLSCSLSSGTALAVANGASARLSGESFSDNVTVGATTTIVLTLSNAAVFEFGTGIGTLACDPAAAPPVSPEGNVTGPCSPATLCFLPGLVGTCGLPATQVPPTSTATPAATATPCAPNCPTPTSLAFVTITPNPATLTAIAGTAVPATAAPPPPGGGEQPGVGGQPTGNTPGGGAGAGGSGSITLPNTGAGDDGGIDWTAASWLALVAVAIGGAAGAMYLGAAHLSASRSERGDD